MSLRMMQRITNYLLFLMPACSIHTLINAATKRLARKCRVGKKGGPWFCTNWRLDVRVLGERSAVVSSPEDGIITITIIAVEDGGAQNTLRSGCRNGARTRKGWPFALCSRRRLRRLPRDRPGRLLAPSRRAPRAVGAAEAALALTDEDAIGPEESLAVGATAGGHGLTGRARGAGS